MSLAAPVPQPPRRRVWFVCDGCGLVCLPITYGLLIWANVVVLRQGSWPWGRTGARVCTGFYELWFVMAIWSHLTAMLTDPSALPLDMEAEDGVKQCPKCRTPKPPRAHHCSIC